MLHKYSLWWTLSPISQRAGHLSIKSSSELSLDFEFRTTLDSLHTNLPLVSFHVDMNITKFNLDMIILQKEKALSHFSIYNTSAFRTIWLVPLSRDIKYYSPPGGFRRKKWRANPILS